MREIRERFHVTAATVRYYERIGLLGHVDRDAGNRRVLSLSQQERLEQVVEWRRQGLTMREIRQLLDLESGNVVDITASVTEGLHELRLRLAAHETLVTKMLEQMRHLTHSKPASIDAERERRGARPA